MIVPIDQLDDSSKRYEIWQGKTVREEAAVLSEESLIAAVDKSIDEKVVKNNILGTEENMLKRKKMLQTQAPEPAEFAFERAIGKNDSVYSNFVELIEEAKRKVGRIVVKQGSKIVGYATGFMVSEKLLLTNWHVFKSEDEVAESEVQFFYELDTRGNPGQPVSFKLSSEDFFYSFKELDYCFVAVNTTDVTGSVSLSAIGYIYLDPALGKLGNEREESLNIIHHPDGDFKQLSIRENLFTKIMPTTIWYESDTAQGSSGSPVFNDQWQVVGLHHMGVPRRNDAGDYLDKNGNIIPKNGNNIDVSRIHWIANEGIRISVILKDIFSKYPDAPILNGLKQPASPGAHENKPLSNKTDNQEKNTKMETNNTSQVQISFPASLVEANGNVNINISNKAGEGTASLLRSATKTAPTSQEEFLEEAKKIEQENNLDFSSCKGYLPKFLGIDIPMPQPTKPIQKFIAKLKGTDSNILKYYHYSVIFHSVRMMPVISAINVDGDQGKRLDRTKRGTDVWLRDNRLDYDIQLDDKYYRGSGFDRGHMSRREDANWGTTAEDARLFADLTCMYTNACPQINTLNQSKRGGLWGKLETVVLETGAIQERGKTAKISVFNGPIFNDEKDPVFKGIQVPMEFYKIILWFNDKKELKATAFRLSQTELVDDIDFEAIDIDANIEFKEYQCSIKSLERDTRLDFSHILKFDTYNKANKRESTAIGSEDELKTFISSL